MPIVNKVVTGVRDGRSSNNSSSIFDASVPVSELPDTGYKFLVFGQSGTGKTTLACTFPKPLLLIRPEEVEDGSRSVRSVEGVLATPYLTTPDQLSEICDGQRRASRYKTLVLDGVTKFQGLVVKKHMGLEDVPIQQTWGMVASSDWGRINITIQDLLRELLRLSETGTHIVVVGGERTIGENNQDIGTVSVAVPRVMVALTPGSTGWLHEVCDYNVQCFKRQKVVNRVLKVGGKDVVKTETTNKVDYCLRIEDQVLYATKFRVSKGVILPDVIVDPEFSKLDSLIRSK